MFDLARTGVLTGSGLAASGLMTFALAVVVSRTLGPKGTGVFYVGVAVFSVLTYIGQFGADIGLLRSIPAHMTAGRIPSVGRDLKIALLPVAIGGTALAVGLAAVGLVLRAKPGHQELGTCLVVLSPFVVPVALSGPMIAATRAMGTTRPFLLVDTLAKPALRIIAVGLIATLASAGALPAIAIWATMGGVTAAAGGIWLRLIYRHALQSEPKSGMDPAPPRSALVHFWRFAAPRALGSALQIVLLWLDVLMLDGLRGPTAAGVYSAAIRYLALGNLALSAAILVVAPAASRYFAQGDIGRVAKVYKASTLWLCVLSLPIVAATAAFSPAFMEVFGPQFARGSSALAILSVAMAVNVACGPVNTVLLMGGGSILNMLDVGAAVILNLVLNLALIPEYGATGAAVAWSIAIVVTNVVPLFQVRRRWSIHPGSKALFVSVLLAAGACAIPELAVRSAAGASPVVAASAVAGSTALYGIGLWIFRRQLGTPTGVSAMFSSSWRRRASIPPASMAHGGER